MNETGDTESNDTTADSDFETDSGFDTGTDSTSTADTDTLPDSSWGTHKDTDTPQDSGSEQDSDSESDTPVQTSTLVGTTPSEGSKYDTWNNADNWDNRIIPSGSAAAVISEGVVAVVDHEATPTYSGGLVLEANASLTIGFFQVRAANLNGLGTGTITMRAGSEIIARAGLENYDFFQGIVLEGDATLWGGISTANHWSTKTFSGGIRGAGQLTYNGVKGTWFVFDTANPSWAGGLQTGDPQNEKHEVVAAADGCFGTGHVSINNNCTLLVTADLTDTIDNAASLTLNGAKSEDQPAKLVLTSNEAVGALFIDDVPMPAGQYTNSEDWLSGNGILTVLTGP